RRPRMRARRRVDLPPDARETARPRTSQFSSRMVDGDCRAYVLLRQWRRAAPGGRLWRNHGGGLHAIRMLQDLNPQGQSACSGVGPGALGGMHDGTNGIQLLDRNGRRLYVSPGFAAMLGYSTDEILQLDLWALNPPEERPTAEKVFRELVDRPGASMVLRL